MTEVSITLALLAGLISFLSPCVLPLLPGYLAYLAGTTLSEATMRRKDIFLAALWFVVGFAAVFAVLGVLLNTLLEAVAYDAQIWLARIGGALIIFFGLYLVGLVKIPFLERELRLKVTRKFKSRYFTSFIFGSAFAAGWTPCVGAVLGGILGFAATKPGAAFILLLSYALGLGLPFLVVGFFTTRASKLIARIAPYLKYINKIFGLVLIILGVLAFTRNLGRIANLDFMMRVFQIFEQ